MPTTTTNSWLIFKRLLGYTNRYRRFFVFGLLGFMIYAATQMAWPELLKYIINAIESGDQRAKNLIVVAIISIFFVRGIGGFIGTYCLSFVARKVVHVLRCEVFEHLLHLNTDYYERHSGARLLSKITYNIEQVAMTAGEALKVLMQEGLIVVCLLSYLVYSNWKLSLLFFFILPIIGLVVRFASRRLQRVSHRIQESMGDVTHVASETITAYKVVKLFGGESFEQNRFEQSSGNNLRQSMKLVVTQAANTPIVQFIVALAMSLMVWLALQPDLFGDVTAADFIAYLTAAGLLAKPIRQLTQVNGTIQRGIAGIESIFLLLDVPREKDDGSEETRLHGKIEFDHVSFQYPVAADSEVDTAQEQAEPQPVLQNISLSIEPGQTVALVGPSGAGKTTLAHLLPRFHEVTAGQIALDGHSIEAYSLSSLRANIALVSQDVALFNASVAHNIAYGMMDQVTEEQILKAAEDANALAFINELPEGIHTLLGDDGVQLSGGQRQRIAIARAILKNAPILILDEATSALDSVTERAVQTALDRIMQDRTTLVIAHRLSTIEAADLIVVLVDGQIVEQGTHQSLLTQQGVYAELSHSFSKSRSASATLENSLAD